MNQDKIYIGLIVGLVGLFLASLIFQNSALQDIKWFSLFAAAVLGAWKFLRQTKISNTIQKYSSQKNNSSGANYGIKECEEKAKEWAKDSYDHISKGQELSFAWNRAKTDIAPLYDFSSGEFTKVRYFYTNYGPKNKPTYIYVDATNGTVITSFPDDSVDDSNPFDALEGYKLTKKTLPRLISAQAKQDDGGVIEDFNLELGGKSTNKNNSGGE